MSRPTGSPLFEVRLPDSLAENISAIGTLVGSVRVTLQLPAR